MQESLSEPSDPRTVTAEIVSAFVLKNRLPAAELPALIQSIYATVAQLGSETVISKSTAVSGASAASIRKSITPDYLVCFEDGLRFKSLRRHLKGLGMTPEEYRTKWQLPVDYPMLAPNTAARRFEIAKHTEFGRSVHKRGRQKSKKPPEAAFQSDL